MIRSYMFHLVRLLQPIFRTSVAVLRERVYQILTLGTALGFFGLYLVIPASLVPGDSLSFELARLTPINVALLAALALMTGMMLSFELYAFKRSRRNGLAAVGEESVGIAASVMGGILAAASCGCGIGLLLGAVGLGGGALFVAANQTGIVLAMLGIVTIGLYFSARRAAGMCTFCLV